MDKANESFMRDNTAKQMAQLNKTISAAGGDIGANSNTTPENNLQYMDNPFNQSKRHIDTYEHYIKNDAVIKTPTDKTNNSKFGKVTKMSESTDLDKYENVVFMQGEEAEEPLRILDEQGEEAALNYLKQWHDYGHHEGVSELGHGSSDYTYEKDGYIMSWNTRLGYIGLQYEFGVNESKHHLDSTDARSAASVIKRNLKTDNPTEQEVRDALPFLLKRIDDESFELVLHNLVDMGVDINTNPQEEINEAKKTKKDSKKDSKKDFKVEDKTKEETHDKTIIWKYEDYIINGDKHVNTNTVEDKDRPFIDNTPKGVKESATYPKSKLSDKFDMMLHDDLKELKCGTFHVDGYDLYLDDKKLFKINPDKDSVKSIIKKVKEKCDL